ncbi:uncharacterized protein C16orf95 homolog [Dasypus novemcinctus]|uniref:uncharacterized protein C16orf95 homolog n=1 Tax=Dasypus novemcinctus TaxID=9361 RepID=UPI00265D9B57|nr:uncharacterized protein C16orf95 homolog [Dasypus novemcinctus]
MPAAEASPHASRAWEDDPPLGFGDRSRETAAPDPSQHPALSLPQARVLGASLFFSRSSFHTFRKEVPSPDVSPAVSAPAQVRRVPSTGGRESCCVCQVRFGGRLPVPRAEAALPYWVPLSLRPQRQVQKSGRLCTPRTSRACPCPCHHFGGCLPRPRHEVALPYWVPRILRTPRKVVTRLQSAVGIPDPAPGARSRYRGWRVCGDAHLLLKWQRLQALHRDKAPVPLLPFGLGLLGLLHALLRVVAALRQFFGV